MLLYELDFSAFSAGFLNSICRHFTGLKSRLLEVNQGISHVKSNYGISLILSQQNLSRKIWFMWNLIHMSTACCVSTVFRVVKVTHRSFSHLFANHMRKFLSNSAFVFVIAIVSWRNLDYLCRGFDAKKVLRVWRQSAGCKFWKYYQHPWSSQAWWQLLIIAACAVNWKLIQLLSCARHTSESTRGQGESFAGRWSCSSSVP